MNNKEIQQRLQRAVNDAPIDLFKTIQDTPIEKMQKHDSVTEQEKSSIHRRFLRPLSLGVSFMLMIVMGLTGWYYYSFSPDSYLYFDVNPGIEIVTNRQDQVIDVSGSNDLGKEIIASIDYRKKEIGQVQEQILDNMLEKGILKDTRQVMLVSAFNKDQEKSKEILRNFDNTIHQYFDDKEFTLVVLRQVIDKNSTLVEFSENYNMTMGKITFIRNLMILNPDFLLEDLVHLSLKELLMLSLQTDLRLDRIVESDDNYEEFRLPDIPESSEPETEPQNQPKPGLSERVSMHEAKEIALNRVGGGMVIELEYDADDQEYEITIQFNGYEYEIEMDALTGDITEIDSDELDDDDRFYGDPGLIGLNQAREIALNRVGGGIIEKIELDEEDDRFIYEVELDFDGVEYELEIDAYTGEILSFEKDD